MGPPVGPPAGPLARQLTELLTGRLTGRLTGVTQLMVLRQVVQAVRAAPVGSVVAQRQVPLSSKALWKALLLEQRLKQEGLQPPLSLELDRVRLQVALQEEQSMQLAEGMQQIARYSGQASGLGPRPPHPNCSQMPEKLQDAHVFRHLLVRTDARLWLSSHPFGLSLAPLLAQIWQRGQWRRMPRLPCTDACGLYFEEMSAHTSQDLAPFL